MLKRAFFRFEASLLIGAGHAIRSCVLADALVEHGWECNIVTTAKTYEFINNLNRFDRIEPENFYNNPVLCDLLVIDNYDIDQVYEKHFRSFAKKIMIIDDLANRQHDCDVLLDQTYGRDPNDYKNLVPENCTILAGSDYVLLRKEFIVMRPKAIEKRRNTKEIKRILISMGGSDPDNYTLKALELVKKSGFKGNIDVVLGFAGNNLEQIKQYVTSMINKVDFHANANMAELMYEADLAIGAAGSSVWERCCLGLPQYLIQTAENQNCNFNSLKELGMVDSLSNLLLRKDFYKFSEKINIDCFGINRIIISLVINDCLKPINFRKVNMSDKDLIYSWQNIKEVRMYFNNPNPPSLIEHELWFSSRLKQIENPYWFINYDNKDCGIISLTYDHSNKNYNLSWFVIPEKRGNRLGGEALKIAINIVKPIKIHASVHKDNIASHKIFKNLGFIKIINNKDTSITYIG